MRRYDVKPGVVYAYRQPVSNEVVPVVFLSDQNWVGTLRQDALGYGDRAFRRPQGAGRKVQSGTVWNDGAIGFPAVIFPDEGTRPAVRDIGRLITLRDFDDASKADNDGIVFILVTSMARVVGEWLTVPAGKE